MRGQWFIDGTWQPLDEDESNLIELEHLKCFRGHQMHDNFDLEVAKPVDHKDGEILSPPPPFSAHNIGKNSAERGLLFSMIENPIGLLCNEWTRCGDLGTR